MMQAVSTWDLNEIIPIVQNIDFSAGTYAVSINADVNGYDWTITGLTGTVGFGNGLYGEKDSQFAALSNLWATYRITGLELDY
jgi:hypothetical protein